MADFSNYIKGDAVMLYIQVDQDGVNSWLPVGCLTSTPFSRSTGRIEIGGRGSGNYKAYLPTIHDYSLSCSGILTKDEGVVSYNDLDWLQDNRIVFRWRMASADGHIAKTGDAFITDLGLTADANAWCSFSCTFSPGILGLGNILVWSQDGFNIVSQNGENAIQI